MFVYQLPQLCVHLIADFVEDDLISKQKINACADYMLDRAIEMCKEMYDYINNEKVKLTKQELATINTGLKVTASEVNCSTLKQYKLAELQCYKAYVELKKQWSKPLYKLQTEVLHQKDSERILRYTYLRYSAYECIKAQHMPVAICTPIKEEYSENNIPIVYTMPNQWIQFVRDYASANNLSYGCALSKPEIKEEYRKKYPKPLTKAQQKQLMKPVVLQESRPSGNVKSLVTLPKAGNSYKAPAIKKVESKKSAPKSKVKAGAFDNYSVGQTVIYHWKGVGAGKYNEPDPLKLKITAKVVKINPRTMTLLFASPEIGERTITVAQAKQRLDGYK